MKLTDATRFGKACWIFTTATNTLFLALACADLVNIVGSFYYITPSVCRTLYRIQIFVYGLAKCV